MPVSIRCAKRTPRSTSRVCTAPLSPYGVALVSRTASSSPSKTTSSATGPKISWPSSGESSGRPASTVGSTRLPRVDPRTRACAPDSTAWSTSAVRASAWKELISGPMWVSASWGSPVFRLRTRAVNFSVNSSATEASTRMRLAAMQTWPW